MFDIIFGYADTYMPLLTLFVFIIFRKNIDKRDNAFLISLLVNVILFAISNIMAFYSINNLFLYHFYYLFEIFFVAWYFSKHLFKSISPLFYIVAGSFTLFWIIDVFAWEPLNVFASFAGAFQKMLIIFLCMYYLFELSKSDDILYFQKLPEFWIVSAFLVSSAMGVLAVVAYKYFEFNNATPGINTWLIEVIGTIFKFVFLTIAFLCYRRRGFRSHSLSLL